MCAKYTILGTHNRSCIISAPSSKWFIVMSTLGLEEDTKSAWGSEERGETPDKVLAFRVSSDPSHA